jgi:hypothetical protein
MSRTIGWPVGRAPGSPVGSPIFLQSVQNGNGGGALSPLVNWIAGTGSPSINGATFTTDGATDAVVYDNAASTINVATDTAKLVAEFEILAGSTNDDCGAGWRSSSRLNVATGHSTMGWSYNPALGWHGINVWALGTQTYYFDDKTHGAPGAGMVITVAADLTGGVNPKMYIAINGVWQLQGGVTGGDPSGGNGWVINGNVSAYLSAFAQITGLSMKARPPQLLPAGYTRVT